MIFITGSNGFVGQRLTRRLLKKGAVVGLDIVPTYLGTPIPESHPFYSLTGSTLDYELLKKAFEKHRPKTVIHMGMVSTPKETLRDPDKASRSILEGTKNIALLANEFSTEKFIHFSSSHVYGDAGLEDLTEDDKLLPTSLYGKIKKEAEDHLNELRRTTDMNIHIIRPTSLYGPDDRAKRVVSLFIDKALNHEAFVINDTKSLMDFTYIDDFLDGLETLIEKEDLRNFTLNLSRGEGRTLLELAQIIKQNIPHAQFTCETSAQNTKKGQLNIEKAKTLLGFTPKVSLEEGIKRIIDSASKDLR